MHPTASLNVFISSSSFLIGMLIFPTYQILSSVTWDSITYSFQSGCLLFISLPKLLDSPVKCSIDITKVSILVLFLIWRRKHIIASPWVCRYFIKLTVPVCFSLFSGMGVRIFQMLFFFFFSWVYWHNPVVLLFIPSIWCIILIDF